MFGKHGTMWQVTLGIVGLAIVAVVLIGPRARGTMISSPSAAVKSSAAVTPAQITSQATPAPAATDPAATQPTPAPPAPAAGTPTGPGNPVSSAANGAVSTTASALPAGLGQTLFSDSFQSAPLTSGVPAGWHLTDPVPAAGSLPVLGGLLGGLLGGGGTSSVTSLPAVLLDGTQHVLGRTSDSWSHISADAAGSSSWADYSVSADVKPMSSSTGMVSVAGRFKDSNNFLSCGIRDGSSLQLWQVVNGQSQLLASQPLSTVSSTFHTLRMVMKGGQIGCSMDGTVSLHGVTSSLTSGGLGLVALGNLAAEFDNVRAATLG
jgi:hypothetical protein